MQRQRDRDRATCKDRETDRKAEPGRQADRQTDRQTDRQSDTAETQRQRARDMQARRQTKDSIAMYVFGQTQKERKNRDKNRKKR